MRMAVAAAARRRRDRRRVWTATAACAAAATYVLVASAAVVAAATGRAPFDALLLGEVDEEALTQDTLHGSLPLAGAPVPELDGVTAAAAVLARGGGGAGTGATGAALRFRGSRGGGEVLGPSGGGGLGAAAGAAGRTVASAAAGARAVAGDAIRTVGAAASKYGPQAAAAARQAGAAAVSAAKAGAAAARDVAAFAVERKAEIQAISAALTSKLNSAAGGGAVVPSMTDEEVCGGCNIALASVIEHTRPTSTTDALLHAIHSACHDQPPVMYESCRALHRVDALAASQLSINRDPSFVCEALGLCYDGQAGADNTAAGAGAKSNLGKAGAAGGIGGKGKSLGK